MAKNRRRCYLDIGIDGSEEGRIVFELFDDLAPRTTENFIRLCTGDAGTGKRGVPLNYKGSCFHRIIKDFMCQGGDFTDGNGTGGESIYGGMFEDEPFIAKHDQPFLLSMANKGPNTNGSQFFITTRPTPHLNGKHVVFGRVVSGTEVVQKMELLKVDGKSKPIADVEILRCGELVRKRQTERREDDSDNEKSSKKKRRHSSSSEEEKENGKADIQISTVKAEDLPPEPANQHSYLMRRSRTPEDRKKKNDDRRRRSRSRDRHDRRGSDRRRDRSRSRDRHRRDDRRDSGRRDRNERIERSTGIKTKGRGVMRFQRDRSTTPPHWSRETKRLKTLDDLHSERERLGGGETVVRRMRGTHADANEDAVPAEKETEIKTETAIEASPRSVHSDAEGVDLSHSEDESDNEGDEAREQARALEALKEREREEKEQQQAKEEAELKSKKEKDEDEKEEEKEKAAANKERSHSRSKTPERRRSRSRSHSRGRRSRSRSRDRRRSRSHERKRSPERRRAGRDRSSSRDHKRSRDRRRRDRSSSRDQRRRRSRSRDTRRRRSRSSS